VPPGVLWAAVPWLPHCMYSAADRRFSGSHCVMCSTSPAGQRQGSARQQRTTSSAPSDLRTCSCGDLKSHGGAQLSALVEEWDKSTQGTLMEHGPTGITFANIAAGGDFVVVKASREERSKSAPPSRNISAMTHLQAGHGAAM